MQKKRVGVCAKSNSSRTVKKLLSLGLIKSEKFASDNRQKLFSLTPKGEKTNLATTSLADKQVGKALENLSDEQQEQVIEGMRLYSGALRKSRMQSNHTIRLIQKDDNAPVARIIRDVMTEFQAVGEGYSINDPEVDDMFRSYRDKRAHHLVEHFLPYCRIQSGCWLVKNQKSWAPCKSQ